MKEETKQDRPRLFGPGGLISAILNTLRGHDGSSFRPSRIGAAREYWLEPVAKTFDETANALERGASRLDVVIACRACAESLRDPDRHDEILKKTETVISTMTVTKP